MEPPVEAPTGTTDENATARPIEIDAEKETCMKYFRGIVNTILYSVQIDAELDQPLPVAGPGETQAAAGQVLLISGRGLHYQPGRKYTMQVLDSPRRQGLDVPACRVDSTLPIDLR